MKLKHLLLTMLCMVTSIGAWGQSLSFPAEASGWTKITAMPDNANDYFYAIYHHSTEHVWSVALGDGVEVEQQGHKIMKFTDNVDPMTTPSAVWEVVKNGDANQPYNIINLENRGYFMQHEWKPIYTWRCSNNGGGSYTWGATAFSYSEDVLPEGAWQLSCNNTGNNFIGPWNFVNNGNQLNDEFACNRASGSTYYDIYAISRADYYKNSFSEQSNVTGLVVNNECINPKFGWTGTEPTYAKDGFEFFNKTFDTYQDVKNLPAGYYKITVQGYDRNTDDVATYGKEDAIKQAYLYAGSASVLMKGIFDDASDTQLNSGTDEVQSNGKYMPQMPATAQKYFEAGKYINELYVYHKGGDLRIGVKKDANGTNDWVYIDNFTLTYVASSPTVGADFTSYITNPKFSGNADGWILTPGGTDKIVRWWGGGNTDLDADGQSGNGHGMLSFGTWESGTRAASASQTITNLPKGYYILGFKYKSEMEGVTAVVGANNASLNIASYNTNQVWMESSMPCLVTEDGNLTINLNVNFTGANMHINLDDFTLTYIGSQPSSEMDFTSFVTNPSFEDDFTGWTNSDSYLKIKSDDSFDGKQGSKYAAVESINVQFSLTQNVQDLPAGFYVVSANANKTGSYGREPALKAGGNSVNIVNLSDNYSVAALLQNAGPLPISFDGKANTGAWAGLDDFKVVYYTELPEVTAVTGTMNETIAATLSTAKETYDAAKTAANYNAFQNANMAAKVSISIYDQISAAIDAQVEADQAKINLLSQDVQDAYNSYIQTIRDKRTYNTLAEAQAELTGAFAYALNSQDDNVDMTALITNPNFVSNADGWEKTTNAVWKTDGVYLGPDGQGGIIEMGIFNASTGQTFNDNISQTISGLPNGKYTMTVGLQAATNVTMTAFANNIKVYYASHGDTGGNTGQKGWDWVSVDCFVLDGNLTIGATASASNAKSAWANCDMFSLKYVSQITDNTDMTAAVNNPSFESNNFDGWTKSGNLGCINNNNNITGKDGNVYIESYYKATDAATSVDGGVEQTLQNMPTGLYKLTVRSNGRNQTEPHVFANEDETMFDGVGDYEVYTSVTDGNLKVGAKFTANKSTDTDHWFALDNFRLTYLGENPTYELATGIMNAEVAQAQTDAETTFNNNKTGANFTALLAAIDNAKASIANYEKVVAYNTKAAALDTDGQAAYAPTLAAYNNGTLTKDGEEAQAKDAYIAAVKAQTTIGSDWTGVLSNPHFYTADKSAWNFNGKSEPNNLNTTTHNCEFYELEFDMSQTISGMKKGTYEISMQAFQRPGEANADLLNKEAEGTWISIAELYTTAESSDVTHIAKEKSTTKIANDDSEIDISGIKYYIPNSMSGARTWFDTEYQDGKNHYVTTARAVVSEDNGDLKFGFRGTKLKKGWLIFDNFTLKYISEDVLVDASESEKLIEQANQIKDGKMNAGVSAALLSAIAALEGDKTNGGYYKTLQDAIPVAQTSIADYANLTKALNEVSSYTPVKPENDFATKLSEIQDAYNASTYETCTDIVNTLYGYKVADYNWVKETYTVENSIVTGLNGAPGTLNTQSYDGGTKPYYDQNTNGSISMTQTITLDAGSYVLVGIGRGSDSGTRSVALTYQPAGSDKTSVNFLMKGDTGLGVDTQGNANFSSTGEYANSNKGRGWEYRFIPFTVDADNTEITIGIDANLNGSWVSFYQPYILMTEETANTSTAQAKGNLMVAINAAKLKANENRGDGIFNVSKSDTERFDGWIAEAQQVYDNAEATKVQCDEAIATLNGREIGNAYATDYNGPATNTRYVITNVSAGYAHVNKAITFIEGGRDNMGMYGVKYLAPANSAYAQAFIVTPVEGKHRTYTLHQIDKDGNARYLCTAAKYSGGIAQQVRTTTTVADAEEYRVDYIKEGVYGLFSIEGNDYVGNSQNNDDAYTTKADNRHHMSVAVAQKESVTLAVSNVHWATFIAPFPVDITGMEGLEAYTVTVGDEGMETTVVENTIPANTPVLLYKNTSETFTSTITDYGTAKQQSYTVGNLVGNIGAASVIVATEGRTDYLLQKNNNVLGFYKIAEYGTLRVGKNRAYLQMDTPAISEARLAFFLDDSITGVDSMNALDDLLNGAQIYDLSGRKLDKLQKGINIVNGKKVILK